MALKCPEKAMYCINGRRGNSTLQRKGLVELGREMNDIVLDTGYSKTIVHHNLVSQMRNCCQGKLSLYVVHMETACCTLLQMSTW